MTDSPRQIQLSDEQQAAYLGLRNQMQQEKPGTALLYGVTGSGKTAVYLKLIADCLAVGKSALLLVPEIALTPQLLNLFTAQFGDLVAVLHSSLRVGERYDEWKRVQSGAARLVIGTRSAVFAPAQNLGLILLDEEQEHTYKSENTPRYHAREVAIYRGVQAGALVVLGSATPSIETMYRAKTGVYRCYSIQQRYQWKSAAAGADHRPQRGDPPRQWNGVGAGASDGDGEKFCSWTSDDSVSQPARQQQTAGLRRLRPCARVPQVQRQPDLSRGQPEADVPLL